MDYGNTGDMRLFAVMNFYYIDYLCRPITIAVVIFYFGGVWQMRCISMVQKNRKKLDYRLIAS